MREHNIESKGEYLTPLFALKKANSSWGSMISGLSAEELADMEQAKSNLQNYESIYEIFEYCA
jgi:hypothetical protein